MALEAAEPVCVCDVPATLGLPPTSVSNHLKQLTALERRAGLLDRQAVAGARS